MVAKTLISAAALASVAIAGPINLARDLKEYKTDVEIHSSCNATQRRMLEKALADTFEVATFAKEYVVTNGAEDPVFQKYFGKEKGAYSTVVGVWDSLLTSNKEGVLLRCDNPDGNCGQPSWRGHWRGDNATSETVICDLSYTDRFYNEYFCMNGYTVAGSPLGTHWSIDLIHRMFHVPAVTNELVGHYSEDYASALELAEHNSTYSPMDSDALQAFAAHVYAVEVAKGGDACIGQPAEAHDDSHAASSSASAAPSATSSAAQSCHTHADGAVHCEDDHADASTTAAAQTSDANAGKDCHTHADGTVHCV
ncbi:uncharacterized protein I303_105697 [Kwoniella dejecticola CBS 10117]|uniref:Putative peptidase domain-containing protein n=1 Tax=Kwoniella dejecticola CBS 10117 TaxID=1296121 RepID=A0A1A6A059_9TREE|nr:uncharacterized protein I303_05718 [Kwoniella dejecticola CBS 10117]OBR83440.1 hypothetical protein I303_05718 [Kwoniella dejecticola CBS 10117]